MSRYTQVVLLELGFFNQAMKKCSHIVLLGLIFCYCLDGSVQGVAAAPSSEDASKVALDVSTLLTCTKEDALCGAIPVNCSYGDRGAQWVEFTQELNYTQVRKVLLREWCYFIASKNEHAGFIYY